MHSFHTVLKGPRTLEKSTATTRAGLSRGPGWAQTTHARLKRNVGMEIFAVFMRGTRRQNVYTTPQHTKPRAGMLGGNSRRLDRRQSRDLVVPYSQSIGFCARRPIRKGEVSARPPGVTYGAGDAMEAMSGPYTT